MNDIRALARVFAFGCVIAIIALSLVNGQVRPHVMPSGNLEHFTAYCGTCFFSVFGFSRRRFWAHAALLSFASALFETAQFFIPGRSAGIDNWIASSAGAWVGALFAIYASRLLVRRLA